MICSACLRSQSLLLFVEEKAGFLSDSRLEVKLVYQARQLSTLFSIEWLAVNFFTILDTVLLILEVLDGALYR